MACDPEELPDRGGSRTTSCPVNWATMKIAMEKTTAAAEIFSKNTFLAVRKSALVVVVQRGRVDSTRSDMHSGVPTNTETSPRALLRAEAVPELYRINAFRVLGLPVEASRRDIRKQEKHHRRSEMLGAKAGAAGLNLAFPPATDTGESTDPKQTEQRLQDVQQAQQRVQEPLLRLLDEFFWFWPQRPGDSSDRALQLVAAGDVQQAHRLWLASEAQPGGSATAGHNLAVLYHATALDFELRPADRTLTEEENGRRLNCWKRTLGRWKKVTQDQACWGRVRQRIVELDDPRLTPFVAGEFKAVLEEVILLMGVRLALRLAESGKFREATEQLGLMRSAAFAGMTVDNVCVDCLRPIQQRISGLCKAARDAVAADCAKADEAITQFLKDVRRPINVATALLSPGSSLLTRLHDEAAETALECQIQFGNRTQNWSRSLKFLETVQKHFKYSQRVQDRLEENLKVVKANQAATACWFCGIHSGHTKSAITRSLYGNVRRKSFGYGMFQATWQKADVTIQRCQECQKHHQRMATASGTGGCLGLLLGLPGFLAIQSMGPRGTWVGLATTVSLAVAFFLIAGAGARSRVPYRIRGEHSVEQHEKIRELRKQGWKYGTQPSELEQKNAPIG